MCNFNNSLKQRYTNSYFLLQELRADEHPLVLRWSCLSSIRVPTYYRCVTTIFSTRSERPKISTLNQFVCLFVYFHNSFDKKCSKKHTQSLSILELDFVLRNRWPTSRFFTAYSYNSMRTIDRPQHTPK